MGFGNKINSFEDDELKARKLKVEITTLEKK